MKGLRNIGLGGGPDIQTGAAIADDIRRFVAAEMRGEAGIGQPGAVGAPAEREKPGLVLQTHCDGVARTQTAATKKLGAAP